MDIKSAIFARRSVRKYLPATVEREKIEYILQAGNYAPTAMNNQDRQFIAVSDTAILDKINAAVKAGSDEATVERICGRDAHGEFNFFYHAPVLIIVASDRDSYYPQADCSCAIENMYLAALDCGLGACWINQLTLKRDNEAIAPLLTELGVKQNYQVYGCLAVGYPDGEVTLSRPKTSEKIIF